MHFQGLGHATILGYSRAAGTFLRSSPSSSLRLAWRPKLALGKQLQMPAELSGNDCVCVPPGELFTADSTLAALVLEGTEAEAHRLEADPPQFSCQMTGSKEGLRVAITRIRYPEPAGQWRTAWVPGPPWMWP